MLLINASTFYLIRQDRHVDLQLLETGFFHADPHPGNMIRTPDGKLAILDFGNNLLHRVYGKCHLTCG